MKSEHLIIYCGGVGGNPYPCLALVIPLETTDYRRQIALMRLRALSHPLPGGVQRSYDAEPAALESCVLAVVQIVLMLEPAPMKSAADARATKAISRVYSMRSCPSSLVRNVARSCFMR